MRNWHSVEGWLDPPGASWVESENAWNFVLYAQSAKRVVLLLFAPDDLDKPCLEYDFDAIANKSGPVWHCRLPEHRMPKAKYYAYRVYGDNEDAFERFDETKLLLDPYAKAVYFPKSFDRELSKTSQSNLGKAPLGVLQKPSKFDWEGDHSIRHDSDLIIYEMHVKGFTASESSGIQEHHRGTFAGVIQKIPYLRELGVTAVELMPIFQFDPQEKNYWGYMTLNFFAPHTEYASHPEASQQQNEFKEMVKALHQAGIEVILDVVYNHTCESDDTGPNYSFRGIDNAMYYMEDPNMPGEYANFTGCGNTLDANSSAVRKLIVDSLQYWRNEMHVDGFRFDLASIFARKRDGSIDSDIPPIISQISSMRDFANVRLIAEPWDAVGAYQLGWSFPGWLWMQWNGQYRDCLQRYVKGDAGLVGEVMTRLYGSADLFPDDIDRSCRPWQSINYITSHDGSTIYDMVSYNGKYNWANGEDNRDGPEEFKWNCGHEGDDDVPAEVMALRERQSKNFMALLMLSNGAPMFRMGDEFLQTQKGNNNAYNQDNETTWLDWSRQDQFGDYFRFVKKMIAFRKNHPSLSRSTFWRDDVQWYGTTGPIDMSHHSQAMAFALRGSRANDQDIYVMINMHPNDLDFSIQEGGQGTWKQMINTAADSPNDIVDEANGKLILQKTLRVEGRSVVVLVKDT